MGGVGRVADGAECEGVATMTQNEMRGEVIKLIARYRKANGVLPHKIIANARTAARLGSTPIAGYVIDVDCFVADNAVYALSKPRNFLDPCGCPTLDDWLL